MELSLEDSHCPGRIRLRGVIENSNEFNEAFSCRAYSNLNLKNQKNQCRIW